MSKQLNLTGDKYNVALVIFFVPYVLFEIPSNILLKHFKPRVWLSLNMFLFGFTTIMQGIVKNYSSLLATRFFLGLFETGMFPGCFYLIGMVSRLRGLVGIMPPVQHNAECCAFSGTGLHSIRDNKPPKTCQWTEQIKNHRLRGFKTRFMV